MREKEILPGICYTDPNGVVRGPFDEWRILDWYRQGFFSNNIHFKLENDDVQFSLGELIDRFGQENPFSSRSSWRVVDSGAPLPIAISPKESDSCCVECRRNGEKLDALLTAVHRLQTVVDRNSAGIASNNQDINNLRHLFEQSRWSAWTWNDNGNSKGDGGVSSPGLLLLDQQRNGDSDVNVKLDDIAIQGLKLNEKGAEEEEESPPPIPATAWVEECLGSAIDDAATLQEVNATAKTELAAELDKIKIAAQSPIKIEPRDTTPKSSPLLERIRKRESAQNGERERQRKGRKSPEDWISNNTRPSAPATFHPFPSATNHNPPNMHQNQAAPWPNLHTPPHLGQHQHWGHNPFAPLQQMHYRNPSSPPCNNGSLAGGHTFAAATLKKDKENNVKKDPLDEGGPRMVPVRTAQRVVMRRAPQKK